MMEGLLLTLTTAERDYILEVARKEGFEWQQ